MNIDLERVKSLTLNKIENNSKKTSFPIKKTLLIAAVITTSSLVLIGAGRLFDWKVMINGEIQQGDFGDEIIVGDGYATMSPQEPTQDGTTVYKMPNYPDSTPDRIPSEGQLSLFIAASDSKMNWIIDYSVSDDETLDLSHIKALAQNAESTVYWPQVIDDSYKVIDGFATFYLKADQLKKAKEVFSAFGEWKNQQVFQLPDDYDKNVRMMSYEFQSPAGNNFRICASNAISDSSVYGGSANAIIEPLKLDGFESVVFVRDGGENTIHSWRKTKQIKTVNPEEFGKKSRPKDNIIDSLPLYDADVLAWQSFDISSKTMSKDELLDILKSVRF
ncbi:MAG: hypothetical protein RSF40_08350 [Oscillospiraceae bacterium]